MSIDKKLAHIFKEGIKKLESHEYDSARSCFMQVLEHAPLDPNAWGNLGLCHKELGQLPEAIKCYLKVVDLNANQRHISLLCIAECKLAMGEAAQAAMLCEQIIGEYKTFAEAWSTASACYAKTGNLEKSISYAESAIRLEPCLFTAHLNHGWALLKQRAYSKALDSTLKAIDINPRSPLAHLNASTIYLQTGLFNQSREEAAIAISLRPGYNDAYINIIKCEKEQGNLNEALRMLHCLGKPTKDSLLLGSEILDDLGDIERAIEYLKAALLLPEQEGANEVLHSLGGLLLKRGQLIEGWELYEHRNRPSFSLSLLNQHTFNNAVHRCSTKGSKILILREQGLGDEILFSSTIPTLLADGLDVTLECDPRLHRLYERSFSKDLTIISEHMKLSKEHFDACMHLCSVPAKLGISERNIGWAHNRHLKACPHQSEEAKKILESFNKQVTIGVCWKSEGPLRKNRKKSIDPHQLTSAITAHCDPLLVNLQYGQASSELSREVLFENDAATYSPTFDLGNDIDSLASYIQACDCIVTISSAVAHLACALGKETHVLLPLSAIWHWGLKADSANFFATAKLYRQQELDNWEHPLMCLRNAIKTRFGMQK